MHRGPSSGGIRVGLLGTRDVFSERGVNEIKVLGSPTPSRSGDPSLTVAQFGYTRWDLGKQPQSRSESATFNFVLVYCQSVVTAKGGRPRTLHTPGRVVPKVHTHDSLTANLLETCRGAR